MVDQEKDKRIEQASSRVGGDGSGQKKEVPTLSFLQVFLNNLKVNALMKKEKPGSEKMDNLKIIEEGLASKNESEKLGAIGRLEELIEVKTKIEVKADSYNAGQLVADVDIPLARKEQIQQVAASIDGNFEGIDNGSILASSEKLDELHKQLELLAIGLGVEVSPEAMEGMSSKLKYLGTLVKARERGVAEGVSLSSLRLYKDEFEPGENGDLLKIRDVPMHEKSAIQTRLEKYKENVRRELLGSDKKALEDLTPDELLKRLEEATYWKENRNTKALFGSGKSEKHNYKRMEKLEDVLGGVEAEYTAAFEKKMEEALAAGGVNNEYVTLATQKALLARKPRFKAQYDFEKGKPAGKTAFEAMRAEVEDGSKKMENAAKKRKKIVVAGRSETLTGHVENEGVEFHSIEEAEKDFKSALSNQAKVDQAFKKLGIRGDVEGNKKIRQMAQRWQEPGGKEEILEEARAKGLNDSDLSEFEKTLDAISGMEGRGRFKGVQEELVTLSIEAERTGNYSKYMIKLQAYIERVGLREASSDYQFAIIMRQAKDQISRINDDAGGKFDLWQESQFLPSITSVDVDTYNKMIPKIVTQLRMKMELEGPMANWLAMQVDGKDGKTAVSVASFYQLLQREDVANIVLSAPVNKNDGTIMALWVEHIWGEGATFVPDETPPGEPQRMHILLPNGQKITELGVGYFTMDDDPKIDSQSSETMQVGDFIRQSMWAAHYAEKLWWYSGEWEPFFRDFPAERSSQANKQLLSLGSAYRDYGMDYGKFDAGYVDLAKAGALLQDFRTYKAPDVIVANVRHMLYDTKLESRDISEEQIPVAKWERGEEIGKTLFAALAKKAEVTKRYQPIASLRPVEEIRLMGDLGKYETPESRWEWYRKSQLKIGRKGVPSYSDIKAFRDKGFESLRGVDEAWFVQAEQIDLLFEDLVNQRKVLGDLSLTKEELYPMMDRQTLVKTGNHREREGINLDEFLRKFEYTSVLNYSEMRKGTDPQDYQKYKDLRNKVAGLVTEVLRPAPSMEKRTELVATMSQFMPPEQVLAWMEAFEERRVQLRTFQGPFDKYDIAMTDLEDWEMRKARGEKVSSTPPIGYNAAPFKIRDERGDSWNVKGRDGFRVVRYKKEWGNHFKKVADVPALTMGQVEIEHKMLLANRLLPNKERAEALLANSFGVGRMINKYFEARGWDPESDNAKLFKKYATKAVLLLRQHPLFDDPVWAFWNILETLREYGEEVQKEMVKTVAK